MATSLPDVIMPVAPRHQPWLRAVLISGVLMGAAPAAQPSVLVLPREAKSGVAADEVDLVTSVLAAEMAKRGSFRVVTFREVENTMSQEQVRQVSGCNAAGCAAEIAGPLNADEIVMGSLGKLGGSFILTTTRVRSRDAAVLARSVERVTATTPEPLVDRLPALVQVLFPESAAPVATTEKRPPLEPAPVPAPQPEASTPAPEKPASVEEPSHHASLPTVVAAVLAPLGVGTLLTLVAAPLALGSTFVVGYVDGYSLGPRGARNASAVATVLIATAVFLVTATLAATILAAGTSGAFALGAWVARKLAGASGPMDGGFRAMALGTTLGAALLVAGAAGTAVMLAAVSYAAGARLSGTVTNLGGSAVFWGAPALAMLGLGAMAAISLGSIAAGGVLLYRNVSSSPPEEEPAAP